MYVVVISWRGGNVIYLNLERIEPGVIISMKTLQKCRKVERIAKAELRNWRNGSIFKKKASEETDVLLLKLLFSVLMSSQ